MAGTGERAEQLGIRTEAQREEAGIRQITQGSIVTVETLAFTLREMRSCWGGLSKGIIRSDFCLSGSLWLLL